MLLLFRSTGDLFASVASRLIEKQDSSRKDLYSTWYFHFVVIFTIGIEENEWKSGVGWKVLYRIFGFRLCVLCDRVLLHLRREMSQLFIVIKVLSIFI